MKSMIALVVVSLLGYCQANPAAVVGGVEMVDAVIDSADKLADLVIKFKDITLGPTIEELDKKIRQIDTSIDGINAEEQRTVRNALEKLIQARKEMMTIRSILTALARETISRSNQLKRVINKLTPNQSNPKKYIEYSARKMIDLMQRSHTVLADSRKMYHEINSGFSSIQADLEFFNRRLHSLIDESGERYKSWVSKTRKIVYGAGAACVLAPPVCAAYYAAAAATLETKIKDYKHAVDVQRQTCNRAIDGVEDSLGQVKTVDRQLSSEIHLIIQWQSRLNEMNLDFASVDDVTFLVDIDREGAIEMLDNLIEACQNYIDNPEFQQ